MSSTICRIRGISPTGISPFSTSRPKSCLLYTSSRTVYAPTGSTIKEYHLYYSPEHFDTLQHIIGANGVPECIPVSQADNTTVRLDILMSEDKKFARLQLLKYENYIFHPATDMFFYSTPEAGRIHELITNHRKE